MEANLGSLQHLKEGECEKRLVEGQTILIHRLSDGFYATSDQCTHLFKSLKKGKVINDQCIECPLHKAQFDIRTGEVVRWANRPKGIQLLNVLRPEKALKSFPITKKDDGYYVTLN